MLLKGTSRVLLPLAVKPFDFGTILKHICSYCKALNRIIIKSAPNTEGQAQTFPNWGCAEESLPDWVTKATSLGGNTVTEVTETADNPQPFICEGKLRSYFAQNYLLHKQHNLLQVRSGTLADARIISLVHMSALCSPQAGPSGRKIIQKFVQPTAGIDAGLKSRVSPLLLEEGRVCVRHLHCKCVESYLNQGKILRHLFYMLPASTSKYEEIHMDERRVYQIALQDS